MEILLVGIILLFLIVCAYMLIGLVLTNQDINHLESKNIVLKVELERLQDQVDFIFKEDLELKVAYAYRPKGNDVITGDTKELGDYHANN